MMRLSAWTSHIFKLITIKLRQKCIEDRKKLMQILELYLANNFGCGY
jgi:hypothetical protein